MTDDRSVQKSADVPDDAPTVRSVYWNRRRPETCHYRWSGVELE
ncbi:hypothetical protein [Halomarina oriensis]|nr:hypothetical protein [Halomarina oriensis]